MKWLPISFKPLLILCFSFFYLNTNSQTLPSFKIHETNGKIFNSRSLIKNKPIVLIYFAPDCEHCTTLLKSVFGKMDQFKKATIVLVSFLPMADVAAFEKNYHTSQYKNVIVGVEEPALFLKNLYKLDFTPFTELFDRKGKSVISYKKETPVKDLIKHLKNIK